VVSLSRAGISTLPDGTEATWNGQFAHLKSALATPAMANFWETRCPIYSEEFREFVHGIDISDALTIDQMFEGFNVEQRDV